jgi:hypothetical protein
MITVKPQFKPNEHLEKLRRGKARKVLQPPAARQQRKINKIY